ncbi:3-phosphoinositide-dependent protein kinase 1-like isoform X1 [Haliotis rufescens]|uniref:3-phosphoinositide-dependent protein kinase 1-like isoform X1 n=2 Tax=Haliotis rufescens TaxID=6454 RepID=UPI00201F853D|nr:3-phosphoinositide-dependent protein kinase 1-like isoform X1 [Haliotis rufescens]
MSGVKAREDMGSRRTSSSSSMSVTDTETTNKPAKKTPNDFIFGKAIGEGSFSTVYLAKEVGVDKEVAVKVLDKRHIIKERKNEYVMREREVLMKLNHPFFIQLFCTFQDTERLYFVLSYARGGELLHYLNKLSSFDVACTQFYAAEIVIALQHLRNLGIIHRDLKPENILLNDEMHIQITDFGSAKILKDSSPVENSKGGDGTPASGGRRNSFVGTAQYVSPEVLTSKKASFSSDLWALGCIIYQFLAGLPPFRGGHEYQIFQKITKLEYDFPEGFPDSATDLVEKLLVIDETNRLGCPELGGFGPLKDHEFFKSINWDTLKDGPAPKMMPYLPATSHNPELWSSERVGFDDKRLVEIITDTVMTADERKKELERQATGNKYHQFVEGNLILKQGLIDKRKGLFARRRMLLLTEGPHLYYVDPANMVLKGQIPWSKELRPEAKNFKIFFVHTPNRTYYLEDPESRTEEWVRKIRDVWRRYYSSDNKPVERP